MYAESPETRVSSCADVRTTAPEAGAVDGVLVWNPNKEPEPAHDAPPDVLWAWADKQKALETSTIRFLPFDVKYLSLLPAGRHKHNYAFVVPAIQPVRRQQEQVLAVLPADHHVLAADLLGEQRHALVAPRLAADRLQTEAAEVARAQQF